MKLLKTILLIAVHGAHASHKVTKNAVDAETTERLGQLAPQPPLRQLWRWQWLLLPLLPLWAYRIGQEELGRRHLGVGADSSINKPIINPPY